RRLKGKGHNACKKKREKTREKGPRNDGIERIKGPSPRGIKERAPRFCQLRAASSIFRCTRIDVSHDATFRPKTQIEQDEFQIGKPVPSPLNDRPRIAPKDKIVPTSIARRQAPRPSAKPLEKGARAHSAAPASTYSRSPSGRDAAAA